MAGHAQLKFVMTECSKTQIRLTGLIYICTPVQLPRLGTANLTVFPGIENILSGQLGF